jgi:uncharacterized protein YlaI
MPIKTVRYYRCDVCDRTVRHDEPDAHPKGWSIDASQRPLAMVLCPKCVAARPAALGPLPTEPEVQHEG